MFYLLPARYLNPTAEKPHRPNEQDAKNNKKERKEKQRSREDKCHQSIQQPQSQKKNSLSNKIDSVESAARQLNTQEKAHVADPVGSCDFWRRSKEVEAVASKATCSSACRKSWWKCENQKDRRSEGQVISRTADQKDGRPVRQATCKTCFTKTCIFIKFTCYTDT